MRILVTGGAGFIGSNFIRYMRNRHPEDNLLNVDLLTYAGNMDNIKEFQDREGYSFYQVDINDQEEMDKVFAQGVDTVINFAAESHVDRSIEDPQTFVETNIKGTTNLLILSFAYRVKRFIQVSTDEAYGSLGKRGVFIESTPLAPNSPYSASKAGADLLAGSFYKTYNLPVIITRSSNNYGPYQFPEKFIPLVVINAYNHQKIPVYGDGLQVRDWIHVEDHCRALDVVMRNGRPGEVYNIGGRCERSNLEVVRTILKIMNRPEKLIALVKDRPGHDRRYAMGINKIRKEIGWRPRVRFEDGLAGTVDWYMKHKDWWERIISGEYKNYYRRLYGARLENRISD